MDEHDRAVLDTARRWYMSPFGRLGDILPESLRYRPPSVWRVVVGRRTLRGEHVRRPAYRAPVGALVHRRLRRMADTPLLPDSVRTDEERAFMARMARWAEYDKRTHSC